MIISQVRLYEYSLALKKPIIVKGQSIEKREGILISLESHHPVLLEGFGEVSPLVGMSTETLKEAREQCLLIKEVLFKKEIDTRFVKLSDINSNFTASMNLLPSVQYGVEMALLNALSQHKKEPFCRNLSENCHTHIAINALLQGETDDLCKEALTMVEQGFRRIKLKVGGDVKKDIEKFKAVSQTIGNKAALHLDANQMWTTEEAIDFGKEIGFDRVEYIEEPIKEIKDIPYFYNETFIPVALDESIANIPIEEIGHIEGVDVVVLKPSIIGSIQKTWDIMNQCRDRAIRSVVSSTFESSIGISMLANLAACQPSNYSAGFDTLKWLKDDLLVKSLEVKNGYLDIPEHSLRHKNINFEHLTEIE